MEPLGFASSVVAVSSATDKFMTSVRSVAQVDPDFDTFMPLMLELDVLQQSLQLLMRDNEVATTATVQRSLTVLKPMVAQMDSMRAQLSAPARWKLGISRVRKTVMLDEFRDKLEDIRNALRVLILVIQMSRTSSQRPAIKEVRKWTDQHYVALRDSRKSSNRKQLADWTLDLLCTRKHTQLLSTDVAGTGDWLFRQKLVKDWKRGRGSKTLFVSGKPGSGKTTTICRLIEWLKNASKDSHAVVFFYFDSTTKPTPYEALGSIASQLCLYNTSSIPAAVMKWAGNSRSPSGKIDTVEEAKLWSAFSSLLRDFSSVTVCLDALDECSDIDGLLRFIGRLQHSHCRLAVSSRPITIFVSTFENANRLIIDEGNHDDIRQYIREFLDSHAKLSDIMDDDLKAHVEKSIAQNANGTFLWPKLALEGILNQTMTFELKRYIQTLPRGLDSTYDLILAKIEEQPRNRARLAHSVLSWLSHAKRPLTLNELRQAVATTPDSSAFDIEKIPPAWAIEETCMGFVSVDQDQDRVQFVHNTIAQYLQSSKDTLFPDGKRTIAYCCLNYLRSNDIASDTKKNGGNIEGQPFAQYASEYWGFHVGEYWQEEVPQITLDLMRVPQTRSSLARHTQENETVLIIPSSRQMQPEPTILHIAAHFDLVEPLESAGLYLEPNTVKSVDYWGRTPLHIASIAGHAKSCKALLKHGADGGHIDISGKTALRYAVINNHADVVSVLCLAGAANNEGAFDSTRTLLEHAAANGFSEIVRILLSAGLSTPEHARFALYLAAGGGHLEIVRLLLDNHIDDNVDQALLSAAGNGSTDIVVLLYDNGANMRAVDTQGLTALHLAAANDHTQLMKILISEGAPLDQTDRKGRTPLFLAAEKGSENAIRLLVGRGAIIDSADLHGCTPLSRSAGNGHAEIVRYLLDHSVRSSSMSSSVSLKTLGHELQRPYESALQIACCNGHDAVVRVLLENSWNPEDRGITNRTPLSYAAGAGHLDVVDRLLNTHKVDMNAEDTAKRTPISYAAALGHESVVEKLLSYAQVDVDAQDELGRTPLSYAAENGHSTIIRNLLLTYLVEVDSSDTQGRTPLSYAASNGHLEVVKALLPLARGDIRIPDRNGQTPLSYATRNGHSVIVKHLQSHSQYVEGPRRHPEPSAPHAEELDV